MPATAGRVRMPANNRVHSSAALQTHGIWQSAIGYDPYAPDQKQPPPAAPGGERDTQISAPSSDQQNAYDSFQGLLALARLTGSNADEARGACRKCGRVGHLPFQCRNFLVLKDEAALAAANAAVATSNLGSYPDGGNGSSHRKDRTHGKHQREGMSASAVSGPSSEEEESSETDESGLSDSSEDSEMERAIAAKYGKNVLNSSLSKKNKSVHSKEQSRRKRSHSKKSKGRRDISSEDTASSEEDLKKAKDRSRSSKRSRREVLDLGTEEDASESESESERERERKRRRHSHKHSKSRSKHGSKYSDEPSERNRKKRSKKKSSSRRHADRKHD